MNIKKIKELEIKYLKAEKLSSKNFEDLYLYYSALYKSADAVILFLNGNIQKYIELSKVNDELISKQEQAIKLQQKYIKILEKFIKVKSDVHTT